ncbi:MAG: DNA mismatch repair protein, partial [Acidobacteriota bacterium]
EVYRLLTDVLNHENRFATVHVAVQFGARGQISALHIQSIDGHKDNRFYRPPLRRLWDRLRLAFAHGHTLRARSLVGRIIRDVFVRTTPLVAPLLQLLGHLEVYLGARAFRRRAEARGRAVTLPTIAVDDDAPLQLDQLWNPLLLPAAQAPVPCTLSSDDGHSLTLITGPNSGGKTRLLQAIGLAQLLGQSGLYVAASTAQLRRVHGLFISLVARETADQAEGRLGRELTRIRALLEAVDPPALVILDELCSGTNPSEGIEVFGLVLRILERLTPRAFITTHFLDYARQLEAQRPIDALRFLQVEVDAGQRPTYRFVPGVAATSMAAVMAERLGMTFERLDALARARQDEVSGP